MQIWRPQKSLLSVQTDQPASCTAVQWSGLKLLLCFFIDAVIVCAMSVACLQWKTDPYNTRFVSTFLFRLILLNYLSWVNPLTFVVLAEERERERERERGGGGERERERDREREREREREDGGGGWRTERE